MVIVHKNQHVIKPGSEVKTAENFSIRGGLDVKFGQKKHNSPPNFTNPFTNIRGLECKPIDCSAQDNSDTVRLYFDYNTEHLYSKKHVNGVQVNEAMTPKSAQIGGLERIVQS